MLLWVINHFNSDFEDSPSMEKHLDKFEKGLEKHVRMSILIIAREYHKAGLAYLP